MLRGALCAWALITIPFKARGQKRSLSLLVNSWFVFQTLFENSYCSHQCEESKWVCIIIPFSWWAPKLSVLIKEERRADRGREKMASCSFLAQWGRGHKHMATQPPALSLCIHLDMSFKNFIIPVKNSRSPRWCLGTSVSPVLFLSYFCIIIWVLKTYLSVCICMCSMCIHVVYFKN